MVQNSTKSKAVEQNNSAVVPADQFGGKITRIKSIGKHITNANVLVVERPLLLMETVIENTAAMNAIFKITFILKLY